MGADETARPAEGLDAGALFRSYGGKVRAYAMHHLGDAQEAEDVVSGVFLKLHEKRREYDPAKGAVSTWLYAITQNEVRCVLRRRARDKTDRRFDGWDDLCAPVPSPEEALLAEEAVETLAQALARLPARERDILLLRFYTGLPSKEIAARMALSDTNVRYLQSKALRKLRGLLEKGNLSL